MSYSFPVLAFPTKADLDQSTGKLSTAQIPDSLASVTGVATGASATDTITYDDTSGKYKPLRRDWISTEEFSGTPDQKIIAAASAAAFSGKRLRLKRNATYDTTTTLDLSAALALGNLTIEAEGAVINHGGGSVYRMQALGTESTKRTLTVSAPANSFTVTLPTGRGAADGWVAGDVIALESTSAVFGPDIGTTSRYVRARELHEILSISGDVLTLDGPLLFDYTTAASARYSKIATGGRLKILGGLGFRSVSATTNGYTFMGKWLKDLVIEGYHAEDHPGGLQLRETVNARLVAPTTKRNSATANPWYYAMSLVGACMGTRIDDYTTRGGAGESSFTTLSDERAVVSGGGIDDTDPLSPNGNTFWGGPINTTLNAPDVVVGSNSTGIGSHSAGYGLTINGGNVIGGNPSYTIRCRSAKLIGCSGLASAGRAVYAPNSAVDLQIIGGEFGQSQQEAISIAGDRTRIIGAYVHDAGLAGSGACVAVSGVDQELRDCTLIEGNTGVQATSTTRFAMIDCRAPKGVRQQSASLGLGATDLVHGGVYLGAGSSSPFATSANGTTYLDVLTDQGQVSNGAMVFARSNASVSYDTLLYSPGFKSLRTSVNFQVDGALRLSTQLGTASKTSAQIDTAFSSNYGATAADGHIFPDTVNGWLYYRSGGLWYRIVGSQIA